MSKTKLTIKKDGPIIIEGEIEILDQEGNVFGLGGRNVLGICRCGLSKNKPFCDGAHKGQFESSCNAFDLPEKK
jgi:CDGSH-type Zn-finger protein